MHRPGSFRSSSTGCAPPFRARHAAGGRRSVLIRTSIATARRTYPGDSKILCKKAGARPDNERDGTRLAAADVNQGEGMIDWEQVARLHGPLVWRTVYRLLGRGGPEAADCFQETFLTALDYARRQEIRNWPGLLTRIATTRALDAVAKRKTESARRTRVDEDHFDR